MTNLYMGTDPITDREWHTSKLDKRQYCGSCEEVFSLDKDKITPKYLDNLPSKNDSTGCCSDISSIPSLTD